jgi:hypothetical protein
VAGRHYLTKAEINALYFATHQMPRPRGWDDPTPIGRYPCNGPFGMVASLLAVLTAAPTVFPGNRSVRGVVLT